MERSERDILRAAHKQLMTSSVKRFTREMFQHMHKTPFIFGDHHDLICDILDKVVHGELRKVMINIAPRYGKTELVSKQFMAYGFAINPACKFLHLSYSGSLTLDNSEEIKDIMRSPLFQCLFDARIRPGRDTKGKWDTTAGGGMYATSTLGQITGFGAGATDTEDGEVSEEFLDQYTAFYNPGKFTGAIVIDDPLKPEDALSDNVREIVNRRFETTIRNRVNSRRTPIIIVMQRLHEHDLCGYLQEVEPGEWTVISIPVIKQDEEGHDQALWSHKHTLEELYALRKVNNFVFETQYMQNPTPLEGLMYTSFRTYSALPTKHKGKTWVIKNYTDSADTGADWYCSIDYVETEVGDYVIDILYTKKPVEFTQQKHAEMMTKDGVEICHFESNNGGRVIAMNVEGLCRGMGNRKTRFHTFVQTGNKNVRIFSRSAEVMNMLYFPTDWQARWPEFSRDMKSYRKEGHNDHDDGPDCCSGIMEKRMLNITQITTEDVMRDFW